MSERSLRLLPLTAARTAALTATLTLGACAGLAPPPAPTSAWGDRLPTIAAPAGARLQADLAIDRWWLAFDDTDLHRLIGQALSRNADLAIAAARLREAHARLAEARGVRLPSLDLRASSARARASADSIGAPAAQTGSSHEVALVGQYEVDLWGRLAAGTDAAQAELAAQAWAHAAVQWSLTAQVAEAHFTLRGLERQIQIAQAVRASRERTTALRNTELQAGAVAEFEWRRAEAELAAADATLASLQRQRLAAQAALSLLAGDAIESLGQAPATRAPLDATEAFEPRLPQGELAELLRRRPDLRQAEARLAASQADIAAARAATLPALRLSGSVGSDVRELANLFNAPGFAWSLAAGVAQSLFDGGRSRARVEQAEARSEAALAQYRRSVAAALIELREAYAALEVQQQALQAERQRVAALGRTQHLARLGLQVGASSQLDALDAERNHFNAQLAEVEAYRQRLVGQVAVFKALGGGHNAAALSASFTGASR